MQQKIIILDFGSQTTQLIGRRVRELDTFCEILPYNKFPVADESVIGVILSGSPYSVHDPQAFKVDLSQFVGKVPVLGICYGAQFIAHTNGGKVEKTNTREYGRAQLCHFDQNNPLFKDFTPNSQVWMSHGDTITQIPEGFEVIGVSFDTNKQQWLRSINELKMVWPQLSDLKGEMSIATEAWGIHSFPANVLIGPDGIIVASNLYNGALEDKVEELLK